MNPNIQPLTQEQAEQLFQSHREKCANTIRRSARVELLGQEHTNRAKAKALGLPMGDNSDGK